jgi:pyruvate formate-lyase/glycerol dehydratase family glycyl radical enzyme
MAATTLKTGFYREFGLTPRLSALRDTYFRALPEVCIERARLVTEFHLSHGLFDKDRISALDKARAYRHVLENREPVVRHGQGYEKGMKRFEIPDPQLFAGSTTGKYKGVPLYPEFLALTLWPELWQLPTRARNPYHITPADVDELNLRIFPHWMERNINELARKKSCRDNLLKYGKENEAPELKLLEKMVFFLASKPNCISHTIPDFSRAVSRGLRAMINEAKERGTLARDEAGRTFYGALSEALEGIVSYSRRLAGRAEQMAAKETDPLAMKELLDLAEIHRRVPEFPARTFREGLTTVWVCWIAAHLENSNVGLSLGRLDQLLYPLFRQDLEAGILDGQGAVELVGCLWLKIGDHVPTVADAGEQLFGGTGSNQAITVGGVDPSGDDAVNDLTYVILQATELMKLRDPNLNARYYPGINGKDYLKRVCEVNLTTGATPAIHNDRAVIKALRQKGDTIEQARDYGVVGCVEPVSNGRAYTHSGAIMLNLTSVLELTLFNGRHRHTGLDRPIGKETGDPAAFQTFGEFRAAFEGQAEWLVEQATVLNNLFGKVHQEVYPTPILSSLFEGPMEKGKDLIDGGAVINGSGAALIGLADVADSLSAIERVVFEEKAVTFETLLDALKKDFQGYEPLQRRLCNPDKTPKYGNEDATADGNVRWVLEVMDRLFGERTNYRGGRYRVGCWTMTNHAGFGRLMGAFPNGRRAGENFASGFTPVSGATPCLTKVLNSAAGQPAACLSNGIALNLKYAPGDGNGSETLNRFAASVEGYFDDDEGRRDGGMEIQFNVTSHEEFEKAVADPEAFPEMLVRVSGYTAYFKDLNPQMQKEIIDRTEYRLSTGRMVSYEPFPLA